eukprot:977472-Pelagomonas_calceolata.AAC.7
MLPSAASRGGGACAGGRVGGEWRGVCRRSSRPPLAGPPTQLPTPEALPTHLVSSRREVQDVVASSIHAKRILWGWCCCGLPLRLLVSSSSRGQRPRWYDVVHCVWVCPHAIWEEMPPTLRFFSSNTNNYYPRYSKCVRNVMNTPLCRGYSPVSLSKQTLIDNRIDNCETFSCNSFKKI